MRSDGARARAAMERISTKAAQRRSWTTIVCVSPLVVLKWQNRVNINAEHRRFGTTIVCVSPLVVLKWPNHPAHTKPPPVYKQADKPADMVAGEHASRHHRCTESIIGVLDTLNYLFLKNIKCGIEIIMRALYTFLKINNLKYLS